MSGSNGNGNLQKHYGALTKQERVRLILEARARGDAQEERALETSARQLTYRMGEHEQTLRYFNVLQMLHTGRVLGWALDLATIGAIGDGEKDKKMRAMCFDAMSLCAKRLLLERDGWAEFCKREDLRPDEKLEQAVRGDASTLEYSYRIAEAIEPGDDDIKGILEKSPVKREYKPYTLEDVVSDYAGAFEAVKQ